MMASPAAVSCRYNDGARIAAQRANGALPAGHDILFLVRADGQLTAVTQSDTAVPQAGDTIVFWDRCLRLSPWMAGRSGRWVSRLAHGLEVLEPNWPAGCGVRAVVGAAIRRCRHPVRNARP